MAAVTSDGTVPHPVAGIPTRTLKIEVLDGPDRGLARIADTLSLGTATGNDIVLRDPTVSRYHAEFSQHAGGIRVSDTGSTNGISLGAVRLERAVVPPGTTLQLGATTIRVSDGETTTVELLADHKLCNLRGQTPTMRRLFAKIERAAASEVSILLVGESGTGKELIAEAIHERSARARGPVVTVDCGALAPTLIASDLFGHERGAFTGADRRHIGAFESAHGGTLFLDEIGELPAQLQAMLLGVLERGRFRRLGGKEDIEVDVRVVSATNRDLRAEVNAGRFRLDLYYRLAVLCLPVPPLRDRVDDIPLLVEHFMRECGHTGAVETVFSQKAMTTLCEHHWPGNVRELRNFVEATLAMGEAPSLGAQRSVPRPEIGADPVPAVVDLIAGVMDKPYKDARSSIVGEFERRYLAALLERCKGNVSQAARTARMDRSHLTGLLKRHKLR